MTLEPAQQRPHLEPRPPPASWCRRVRRRTTLAAANGTGPFTLGEFAEGESITLTRNDAYWGELPQVGSIVFQFFGGDQNALVNALSDGDIQIAVAVNTDLVGPFEDNPDYVISSGPTNGEFTLGLNNAQEALSNPLVRQAITHAIDRHAILDLFNGYGTVIGMPVPPMDPWYEDIDPYPFDPERAKELLAEAGYADGLELDFVYPNHYPLSVADFVVAQLGDVGITVNLEPVDFQGVWLPRVYTDRDYDITAVLHVEPRHQQLRPHRLLLELRQRRGRICSTGAALPDRTSRSPLVRPPA